ncbi:MAG: AAA domain-containing protein [Methanocalculus sp.]|nr:AAA domain-containing protein [Methanocalculus sp.]
MIVAKKDLIPRIEPYLPPDISVDPTTVHQTFSDEFIRRMRAWGTKLDETKSWEEEIAWRICRMHELKTDKKKYESLSREVDMLVPHFESNGSHKNKSRFDLVRDEIHKIRRIALPSVLELLQEGFETSYEGRGHDLIALYSGLAYAGNDPLIFETRHTLLTHQHRMHPDISHLPRKIVYKGEALKNAGGDEGMRREREWRYNGYSSRCVWCDVKPRCSKDVGVGKSRFNLAEVRSIRKALEDFMAWAKDNPNSNDKSGYWSVAILPFYTGQEEKIKKELVNISRKKGLSSEFVRDDCNVTVKICTVDRFQGHEADVVFLSFVQSCRRDGKRCKKISIGFLDFQNRLNVAVTRARYQLVMFGDKQNFEASKSKFLKTLATESTASDIEFGGVS